VRFVDLLMRKPKKPIVRERKIYYDPIWFYGIELGHWQDCPDCDNGTVYGYDDSYCKDHPGFVNCPTCDGRNHLLDATICIIKNSWKSFHSPLWYILVCLGLFHTFYIVVINPNITRCIEFITHSIKEIFYRDECDWFKNVK
jgi:hypothetical protein